MRVLVLEDSTERIRWFRSTLIGTVVDFAVNVEECKKLLTSYTYDMIFLDHDLSERCYEELFSYNSYSEDNKETGYEIALYLSENLTHGDSRIIIHSLSPPGVERIYTVLEKSGYDVQKIPFHVLKDVFKVYR